MFNSNNNLCENKKLKCWINIQMGVIIRLCSVSGVLRGLEMLLVTITNVSKVLRRRHHPDLNRTFVFNISECFHVYISLTIDICDLPRSL